MLQQVDTGHDDFSNDEIKELLHSAEQRLKQATSLHETSPRRIKPVSVSTNPQTVTYETPNLNIQGLD